MNTRRLEFCDQRLAHEWPGPAERFSVAGVYGFVCVGDVAGQAQKKSPP